MNNIIDNVKRFIVVLCTEILFFFMGCGMIYVMYIKCSSINEIISFLNNPLNPITLTILGIGSIGGGYIGAKMWENLQNCNDKDKTVEIKWEVK